MYARKQLDFTYGDLAAAAAYCLRPDRKRDSLLDEIERLWSPRGDAVVTLSVRTAFDAYLTILDLPPGSEVVMSGINIPGMVQIVSEHGLEVVPVDMDMKTLEVKPGRLSEAITPRTRLVVMAHLFGARMDMNPVFDAVGGREDIRVVEDCAQAFRGCNEYMGDDRSDVTLFSFGAIKTASALGGAMICIRDEAMRAAVLQHVGAYRRRGRAGFLWRVVKYGCIKALISTAVGYGMFVWACEATGLDFDKLLITAVRGFGGHEMMTQIRQEPPTSQLSLLRRRLNQWANGVSDGRIEAGDFVRSGIRDVLDVLGADNSTHTYWLFAVHAPNKEQLVADLRAEGFDATSTSTQLQAIRSETEHAGPASECQKSLGGVVYLPVYGSMPQTQLQRLVESIRRSCGASAA